MKILIIGPFPFPIYGVSLSNMVLTNGLLSKGYKVKVINTASGSVIDSNIGGWSFRKLSFLKTYLSFFKVFQSDVIYCTTGQTFFGILKYAPFILCARALNKTTIVHVKGGYLKTSYELMSGLKKKISKSILSSYSGGIVLSKSLKPLLADFLPENKIFIQHNFIQDSLIVPVNEIIEQKTFKSLRLIFLSNLMEEKGVLELLDAFDILNQKNINFQARFAGHIPSDQQRLLSRMEKMNNVEYIGVVQNSEKTKLLSWGNVFCLPTYYPMEGQPISILEAMGFGNVIVTTKHAGIPDVCSDQNALFVEKRDVNSIVSQIMFLSTSLSWLEQTSLFNLKQARELYTEEAFISGILKIMKSLSVINNRNFRTIKDH